jgi:amino acid transporter
MINFDSLNPFNKKEKNTTSIVVDSDDQSIDTTGNGKEVGAISAIFLIFNRMIGTGIFATPSSIYNNSGSVGATLMIWFAGAIIAASGLMVYLEWGSALPQNGGEKNYLAYFYRKPKFLISSMFGSYVFLLGGSAANSVVFGEYIIVAAGQKVDRWNQRGIGLACITFAFLVHSLSVKWGLRLQNLLGLFKFGVIAVIVIAGWVALSGRLNIEPTHAFTNTFSGHTPTGYGVVMALYNVIWSFIGYSTANYALGETKNPNRILKIAAPLAVVAVSILYMLVNISYFAVVPAKTIATSGRILAANFFAIVFGEQAEKALAVFVALSALGNVLVGIFSQGRIVQELGRDGILPFSKIWRSSKPFNTPLAGLFEHWVVSIIIMLAPPPGDAYNFILNLISYPMSCINAAIALGLIILTIRRKHYNWNPPIKATLPVSIFFFISSIYLVVAPFIAPSTPEQSIYKDLPYYLHCVVGIAIFGSGVIYWVVRFHILPRFFDSFIPEDYMYHTGPRTHINKEDISWDPSVSDGSSALGIDQEKLPAVSVTIAPNFS